MPAQAQYGATAKWLHWLITALLVVQFVVGPLMPNVPRYSAPGELMNFHMSIGAVVLALIVLRLAWRLGHPVAADPGLKAWQRIASQATHWLLYALVLASTFTGWSYASMRGWTITLFGTVPLPAIFVQGSPLGRTIGRLHETLVWVLAAVVVLHVLAALIHMVVYRDRIMQRMLPAR